MNKCAPEAVDGMGGFGPACQLGDGITAKEGTEGRGVCVGVELVDVGYALAANASWSFFERPPHCSRML